MNKVKRVVCFLVVSVFFISSMLYAGEKGTVTLLDPPDGAKIQRVNDIDFVAMRPGDAVVEGDKIQTGLNARVEVTFSDGTIIKLKPNTIITVKNLSSDESTGSRNTQLRLFLGTMKSDVEKLKTMDSVFEIHTPTAVAGVRGTSFVAQVDEDRNTNLYVNEGNVYLESILSGQGTMVSPNQAASVDANGSLEEASDVSEGQVPSFDDSTQSSDASNITDTEGNNSLLSSDQIPPDVDISQTDITELTNDPRLLINLMTEPGAEVNINGTVIRADVGSVNYSYTLSEGPNEINISVKDAAGNETIRSITKVLDTTQPILVVTNFQIQENGRLLVEGQTEPGAKVEANGYPLEVRSDGTFYDEIAWTAGTTDVTIEATDLAGNQTLDRRSVSGNIDSNPPQLVSASISPSSAEPGQFVNILVELSDPSGIAGSANYTLSGPAGTIIQGNLLASGSSLAGVASIPADAEPDAYTLSISYADAVGNGASSTQSGLLTIVVNPPSVIAGLAATAGDGKISLSWSPDANRTSVSYNVYRSQDGTSYSLISSAMTPSYDDAAGIINGVTYYYRVSGVDSRGNEGAQSAPASATPIDNTTPNSPVGFSAAPVDASGNTNLTWSAPTTNTDNSTLTDLQGYEFYLNGVLVNPYIPAGTTSYTQGGLSPSSSYKFELRAFDGASPPHKSASATTNL